MVWFCECKLGCGGDGSGLGTEHVESEEGKIITKLDAVVPELDVPAGVEENDHKRKRGASNLTMEKKMRREVRRQERERKEGPDWQGDELGADDGTHAEVNDSDLQQWK